MTSPTSTCGCEHGPGAHGPGNEAAGPGRGPSRRSLLRAAAATGALGVAATVAGEALSTRYAFAADATAATGDVLVVLCLRGGFDGLNAIVPSGDPDYLRLRPTIGLRPAQTLRLDAMFGLHPALAPLLPFWKAGTFGVVHAVGQADASRSHFQAMSELERAAPGTSARTGWLDRTLGLRARGTVFQAAQVGTSSVSGALAGPRPEMSLRTVDGFDLAGAWDGAERARWTTALTALHRGAPATLAAPAAGALGAVGTAARLKTAGYTPAKGAAYPTKSGEPTPLGGALRDVARLVKARVGLQVACVEFGDWDMHEGMGDARDGRLRDHLAELGGALAAFATDLGPLLGGVTVVTLSEFGRRVAENGSGGTDHGFGNAVLLLGGGVRGGTVHGRWPGLARTQLLDGDLAGTTDYRSILADVLTTRCGVADVRTVFPGLTAPPLSVTRPRT